ncbi:thiamin phosphate synthase superfamily [Sulfurifustis variabilis]|uniref:8-oxo-dGTP diphosphatase n=1 Tax=Sulfurifustis variabilis TaxID=1675686 RepID=A0A1B4V1X7_9GAMM|nr:Nudix family hydrolase [Sulfurifustis variabilis]BAU47285.1 thiamin phosphate synthase superfamily [Sulfurifustis variabilis]
MNGGRSATSTIHVVAGLLLDRDRIFITRRPDGRHQGGKWEFPGGKVDVGEAPLDALRRELHEELGIDVQEATPYARSRHAYPDLAVLLDVWRILRYDRTPHGREGQEARWAEVSELRPSEFPAADRPILRRLQLPALYAISDVARLGQDLFAERLLRALEGGVRLVQLREPGLGPDGLLACATKMSALCHRFGAKLLVNADPELAITAGADGVHLSSRRLKAMRARPLDPDLWVAASCHDLEELRHAQAIEADFAVVSPVMATSSHPGASPLGWARLSELCRAVSLPVYALGGMAPRDVEQARQAGAHGVALLSAAWASDFGSSVKGLRG